jgi:predicted PurR-regulated permease PerM
MFKNIPKNLSDQERADYIEHLKKRILDFEGNSQVTEEVLSEVKNSKVNINNGNSQIDNQSSRVSHSSSVSSDTLNNVSVYLFFFFFFDFFFLQDILESITRKLAARISNNNNNNNNNLKKSENSNILFGENSEEDIAAIDGVFNEIEGNTCPICFSLVYYYYYYYYFL